MKNYYSLLNNQLTNNLYLHFRIKFPIFLLSLSLPIIPRQIGRYFGINKRYKETERRYVWQKEAGKQIVKKISQPSSCGSVGTVHSLRRANNNQQQPPHLRRQNPVKIESHPSRKKATLWTTLLDVHPRIYIIHASIQNRLEQSSIVI